MSERAEIIESVARAEYEARERRFARDYEPWEDVHPIVRRICVHDVASHPFNTVRRLYLGDYITVEEFEQHVARLVRLQEEVPA